MALLTSSNSPLVVDAVADELIGNPRPLVAVGRTARGGGSGRVHARPVIAVRAENATEFEGIRSRTEIPFRKNLSGDHSSVTMTTTKLCSDGPPAPGSSVPAGHSRNPGRVSEQPELGSWRHRPFGPGELR